MEIEGLWLGELVGSTCAGMLAAFYVYKADWQALAALARERAQDQEE